MLKKILVSGLWSLVSVCSFANWDFNLNANGTVGVLEDKFINDWSARGQIKYNKFGVVYSMDALSLKWGHAARDAFAYFEDKNLGRIEIGFTPDIAFKMGVGLPDVGGLRLNDHSILYDKIPVGGPVISNTTSTSGFYNLRMNIATVPTNAWQFGISLSPLSNNYKYSGDVAAKYRAPYGKTKIAMTLAASYIEKPENFSVELYAPNLTADSRAQGSVGLNVQYNSFIVGVSARAIYDTNVIGIRSDGISAGAGVSYDFLNYSVSGNYLNSSVGIWDDYENTVVHTGILSLRYKYSKNLNIWISGGISNDEPFIGTGIGGRF